jgi:hypothetical protein
MGMGVLSALGNAQLSVGGTGFWPGMEGNLNLAATTTCSGTCEVTSSGGIRFRGGSIGDPASSLSFQIEELHLHLQHGHQTEVAEVFYIFAN